MRAEYIGHHGDDLLVVNAARVSFDKVSQWEYDDDKRTYQLSQKDRNLIEYLARGMSQQEWYKNINNICELGMLSLFGEKQQARTSYYKQLSNVVESLIYMAQHWAPFSHPHITLRVAAPVPIRTQCFKHKVGFSESEESRRYINSTPELYIPDFREKAENVKQGSGGVHHENIWWQKIYAEQANASIDTYISMIDAGIAEEQARFVLPQGVIVNWIWTGSLAAYARYYNQRTDEHAQKESQELAEKIGSIIRPLYPVSWDALVRSKRVDNE